MKFGLLYEMQRPHDEFTVDYSSLINETIEQCQLADVMGFDHLWFVNFWCRNDILHDFMPNPGRNGWL